MSDRTALLRSICEYPADDTPRLVYADACEEEWGEPERAEFIRVQVELAKWDNKPDPFNNEHLIELRRRERELFWNVWKWIPDNFSNVEWSIDRKRTSTRHFMDQESGKHIDFDWSRGFISSIRCSWSDFLRVESRLIWVPGGTVGCPDCTFQKRCEGWLCDTCECTGRIPRPFVDSMQPVETVELTTAPVNVREQNQVWIGKHRFTSEKCPKCDGYGNQYVGGGKSCPACHGQPLNSWRCGSWPMQRFVMSEAR